MVPISPEIYSGAAVVMDNRSLFDYAQKIEERRAKRALAEQEAIDKYVVEIGKNLTPTGMKVNDIPDYLKMQQEFRELSDKYKTSRNPFDKLALNNKADEMFLFINESKGAVKEGEQPTSTLGDASKRNQVDFETLAKDLELHNLPLRDPNRKKIGALSNYFFPQQFDEVGVFNEAAKGIDKSELGTTIVKGQKIIPVGYGENAIRSIAENYVKLVDINPTAISYYKGKLKNLPAEKIAEAVARVKKYYPQLEIDDDEPSFLKLSDAIEAAEKRTSQKIENAPTTKVSVSTSGSSSRGRIEDITTYRDVGDSKDVTDIFGGIKVTGLPKGESMLAKQILYDKGKNEITLTEWVGRDDAGNPTGERVRKIPFRVFLQNIKTLNPLTDFKYIETLPSAKTGKAPATLTMKESEYRNLSIAKREEFRKKGGVVVK